MADTTGDSLGERGATSGQRASSGPGPSAIHDLGYRGYEGERLGPSHSIRAVARVSAQRALGLRRSARWKIIPVVVIALVFIPSIAMVAASVLIDNPELVPLSSFFSEASIAIVIFAAFAGSEVVTSDLKSGLASLYASTQLGALGFLRAKLIGIFAVIFGVVCFPLLLRILAVLLQDGYPSWFDSVRDVAVGVVVSILIAAMFTSFVVAVSFVTRDFRIAMVAVLAIVLVTAMAAGALVDADRERNEPETTVVATEVGSDQYWFDPGDRSARTVAAAMFSLPALASEIGLRAFGAPAACEFSFDLDNAGCRPIDYPGVPTTLFVLAALMWTLLGLGVARWQLERSLT
ncbi:MAG: hypothetical protein KDB86_11710 [Actinobacteria bacterium]|nr:hypothetical protein [Actinomycetota bacterium]MCB9389309.1 hypothetical protein [Acidimicrobiia bacterium]